MDKNQRITPRVRPGEENSSFINILIIEDEHAGSAVIKLGLHNHHCHTILAHSIEKGFECLATMPEIQIVIYENTMPSSSGLEQVAKIKAHPLWKRIPAILILAKPDSEITQQAIELGCRHVIVKPFNAKLLLNKIEVTLLENSFKTYYHRRIPVPGAIFQRLHHQVAKLAVQAYKHVSRQFKKKDRVASAGERSKPIKGFLHRKSKQSYTTVAEWLSQELRIIRRIKPRMKARHKIVTLAEWLFDEIRIMHDRAPYQKFAKKKDAKTERPPQTASLRDCVKAAASPKPLDSRSVKPDFLINIQYQKAAKKEDPKPERPSQAALLQDFFRTADPPQPLDRLPVKPDVPINIQYMILFQKAPYLLSKKMQRQIKSTVSKD